MGQSAVTQLELLRSRLARLRSRRQHVRRVAAWSTVALAVLWTLAAFFVIDWMLEMSRLQRGVAWVATIGLVSWVYVRLAQQWLARRESEIDIALLVEQRHQIDSDLVAALQFEQPEAESWGSSQLEQAVVEKAARRTPHLGFADPAPPPGLRRRFLLVGITLLLAATVVLLAPAHLGVFVRRLFFSNRHYPTDTQIVRVAVNGRPVLDGEGLAGAARVARGRPVELVVEAAGELPSTGHAELAATVTGQSSRLELVADRQEPDRFSGRLEPLAESVRCTVLVGDAWTEPIEIELVEPPRLRLHWQVEPPPYVRAESAVRQPPAGLRQISVLEGSNVHLTVKADQALSRIALTIEEKPYPLRLVAANGDATPGSIADKEASARWVLPHGQTPLDSVVQTLRYAVTAVDSQGVSLPETIEGSIRVVPDQAPRVSATAITRHVLPAARPTVRYRVDDDYGLANLSITYEIVRRDGSTEAVQRPVVNYEDADDRPLKIDDALRLELSRLELSKGDELRVTLTATDFRGPRPGESSQSEPLVFQVTDKQGILGLMAESDEEAVEELEMMIRRQMDLGEESP